MSMYGSTVPGNGKTFIRNDARFQGRKDGCQIEKLLERSFIIQRDIFMLKEMFSDFFGDFRTAFQSFLISAFRFLRFCTLP